MMPILPLLLAAQAAVGHGPDTGSAADAHPGISYVDYRVDAITVVAVQRGTATRIVLAPEERILRDGAGTGYAADCSKNELAWCMRADPGSNQLLIRPKSGATGNNLELRTDKRDYSFRFEVLPDPVQPSQDRRKAGPERLPVHRIIFRYPDSVAATLPPSPARPSAAELIDAAQPTPRNWQYSMQVLPGGEDIMPALVFDDGRFTYLQFPANRELPTIYYIAATGEEARVNFHMDQHDAGLLVVERMARCFVLRLGSAVVGIWNDAYDSYGVAPLNGTTVDGLVRRLKQEQP